MKRHQICLLLSIVNKYLGDRFVTMEIRKLNRGLPFLYQQHITKTTQAADLRASQVELSDAISWISQTYMKRKDGFLKDFRNIKPHDSVAVFLTDLFNEANLPIPEDLMQKANQIRSQDLYQNQSLL